jgi:lipoprotein-anchoring transpeptidase ErfK/SrfK
MNEITRRDFLKLLAAGVSGLGLLENLSGTGFQPGYASFARVLEADTPIYSEPSIAAPTTAYYWQDAVLPILETLSGEVPGTGGWYHLAELGYVPAERVQPVGFEIHQPDENISRQGSLAVISVPYAAARFQPRISSQQIYRFYYGSTHWVNKLIYDRYGRGWYRVEDDKYPEFERWVLASRMRIIPAEELAPLSPDVPPDEKTLQVNLGSQMVTAFEYDEPVFEAVISSGDSNTNPNYQTPTGVYRVGFKRPSQHMLPWDQTFGDYDLPGVPWVCYFTQRAHAFHGAFWHNGFGTPRSHGCVNLKPEDALWVYRWTTPVVQAHDDMEASTYGGTLVEVV